MESTPDNRPRRPRTEPSRPGWLGLFFGETYSRRLTVAFSFAIAIVAILVPIFVALLMTRAPEPADEVVANVEVVKISHKPKPTPSPTPRPTPKIMPRILAQVVDPGKSSRREIVKKPAANRPKVVTKYHSKPIVSVPMGGQGAGAGSKGTVGSLGNGGNGSGASAQGNGSGGVCGVIDFVVSGDPSFDPATHTYTYDRVQMIVHYTDGHAETTVLDYPWHYRTVEGNPFKSDAPILFQFPPKSMRASEPTIVQYVMAHETGMGDIALAQCSVVPTLPPSQP